MIHESLPTCEKMNRIVTKEKNYFKYIEGDGFYSQKYDKYTNDGYCPCCGQDYETVEHLFAHCENEEILELRNTINYKIHKVMQDKIEPGTPNPTKFFYDNKNQEEQSNDNWDLYLGNLGIIPKTVEKEVFDLLDDNSKHKLKYILCDISEAIHKQNIEIWKHRCKLLYGSKNNNTPP